MKNNLKPLIDSITLSTTFIHKKPGQEGYSRVDNPTRLSLERELAKLEKAKFALAFSSGSAAITTILASLKKDDHIVCHEEIYEGTLRLLESIFKKFGLTFSLVNLLKPGKVNKFLKKNTKLIWLENITNPTLKVINVNKICQVVRKKDIKVVVDNTFATPLFENPLVDGANIVVHSLTKFISGHHDVTAGAIMFNDKKLFEELNFLQQTIGAVPSPFDCFLIRRGMETLELRMKKHQENANKITEFLRFHKNIKKVSFPRISGLVSFWTKGDLDQTLKFLNKLKTIKIAHSFGGTTTTILHPISMMNFSLTKTKLKNLGITDNLLRLSVGLEQPDLIIKDLKHSLE